MIAAGRGAKKGESEAEKRKGCMLPETTDEPTSCSAFNRRAEARMEAQVVAEGTDPSRRDGVQCSHCCIVLFPLIREACRCSSEFWWDE